MIIDSWRERAKREHEERISAAYMTALWSAQWWSKKPPEPLEKILGYTGKPREMTDEEMFELVKDLNAAIGGKVVKHGDS